MNQTQTARRTTRRALRTAVLTAVVATALGLGAGPATARPDAGQPSGQHAEKASCALERVGTEFVKCDDNTGNGVSAPAYIPER